MKKGICTRAATAILLTGCLADGAVMTQYSPVVQSAAIKLDLALINNDPAAIYNSAVLNLDALCGNVADIVIARNADYVGFTRNQVLQEWGISIREPSAGGEVYDKWYVALDSGQVSLTHVGLGYTQWLSTDQNSSQDLMFLTISIPKSQLDFNGNGIFDAETEAVYLTGQTVADAFVGVHDIDNQYFASGTSYSVIPEPATAGLLGIGVLLAFGLKKLRDFYAR